MRLIIDTNQTNPIRFNHQKLERGAYPTLVIPFLVWVELLAGPDAVKRRRALQKFPLLFGMEMGRIFDALATLSEQQIRSFVPIYPECSQVHKTIAKTFVHPTHGQKNTAREIRQSGQRYRQRMINQFPDLRKKHKKQNMAAQARGETQEYTKWSTIQDCEHDLFLKVDAPFRRELIEDVSTDANGNARSIVAESDNAMFDAAWANPMLRRFIQLQALVRLGYAQNVWEDSELNRLPKMNQDDRPDISLVLYARNGDTILTADNSIKQRIRHVDKAESVNLSTWDDWLAAQA